jgi:hypothetical protein
MLGVFLCLLSKPVKSKIGQSIKVMLQTFNLKNADQYRVAERRILKLEAKLPK